MIQPGDVVEARLVDQEDPQRVVIQQFTVTGVEGTMYHGATIDCDTGSGWQVRLVRKDLANLQLPTTISEIVAKDRSNVPHLLTGKGETWRDETGALFDPYEIFSWGPAPE